MSESKNTKLLNSNKILGKINWQTVLLLTIVLFSLGSAVYFWNEAQKAKNQTPEAIAAKNQQESERVISKLNKILLTESDQPPTVARVDDPEALKKVNDDFYKHVQEGDYLILYPNRAIIYREQDNRIINVAPIIAPEQDINSESSSPQ